MDPRRANGGVFLGLEGIVIKSHGGTDDIGFAGAIDIGYKMVRQDLLSRIRESLAIWQDSRTVLAAASLAASPGPETD
jgi:glycerol-3-phosphate acyltransferase PlsX